jgi:hypothetical protein
MSYQTIRVRGRSGAKGNQGIKERVVERIKEK